MSVPFAFGGIYVKLTDNRFPSIIVLVRTYFDRNVIVILLIISIGRGFLVLRGGMRLIILINRKDGRRRFKSDHIEWCWGKRGMDVKGV